MTSAQYAFIKEDNKDNYIAIEIPELWNWLNYSKVIDGL